MGTPDGVVAVGAADPDLAVGDLVELSQGMARLAARNVSMRAIHEQDWWRLQRVLPALRRRARLTAAIRAWFDARGFLEVETPLLCESPGLEVHLAAIEARPGGRTCWLVTSPEYHMKRLLSAGEPRIVSLGRVFRDDEHGPHHHREFTLLEWYRAGEGPDGLMADVEALVALATGQPRTWTRITVREALARWAEPTDDPDAIVRHLVERIEPQLAELGAVFLTGYPSCLASLARIDPTDPTVSERFEAYVDGIELANGFGELTCAAEQRLRLEADLAERIRLGLPEYPIDERFLDALAAGLPRCAGIALGLDRLVLLAERAHALDDVIAFPPDLA